jgi:LysM repeat protein
MAKNKTATAMLAGSLAVCLILASLIPTAAAASLPVSAYISGVTGHAQALSLSCEARSAADWAAYWGVDISEIDFQQGLPGSDNPDRGFVGSPNDPWGSIPPHSYGVYARPVAARLREYGLKAEAQRGLAWDDLRSEIAAGRPVIVWIIGQMWNGTPLGYTASDGKKTTVARFEHTMILIGYDTSQVHVVDAYSGLTQTYALSTFLKSWSVLGDMAVFGQGSPVPTQAPKTGSGKPGSYIVQSGDYLTGLAVRFKTTWQELARLNDIPYPYTIYAGQVLKLPGSVKAPSKVPTATHAPPKPTRTPRATPTLTSIAPTLEPLNLPYKYVLPLVLLAGVENKPVQTAVPQKAKKKTQATYVVQHGDFLIDLGDRLGIDWRSLADLNDIFYPWVIYPGQVLKLPAK